ncbi:MAG: hypothetical protein PVG83_03980 [Acidimicrobiia bacterium]|jgi:hypothetical protein
MGATDDGVVVDVVELVLVVDVVDVVLDFVVDVDVVADVGGELSLEPSALQPTRATSTNSVDHLQAMDHLYPNYAIEMETTQGAKGLRNRSVNAGYA